LANFAAALEDAAAHICMAEAGENVSTNIWKQLSTSKNKWWL
jgi:hypothetical protein